MKVELHRDVIDLIRRKTGKDLLVRVPTCSPSVARSLNAVLGIIEKG